MNLVRFDPFNELDTVFSQLVGRPARWPRLSLERNGAKPEWSPCADISETDAEYVIRAELPAVQKETSRSPSMRARSPSKASASSTRRTRTRSTTASRTSTVASSAASHCPRISTQRRSAATARMGSLPFTSPRNRPPGPSPSRSACSDRQPGRWPQGERPGREAHHAVFDHRGSAPPGASCIAAARPVHLSPSLQPCLGTIWQPV